MFRLEEHSCCAKTGREGHATGPRKNGKVVRAGSGGRGAQSKGRLLGEEVRKDRGGPISQGLVGQAKTFGL